MNDTSADGAFMLDFLSIKYNFAGKDTQNKAILIENIEKEAPKVYVIWLVFRIFA